jgi:hypothetical protein
MIKLLLVWHRRFALLCVAPFCVWALSGLLHPVMSHFAKAERLSTPLIKVPSSVASMSVPLKSVLVAHQISAFSHASVVEYHDEFYYQVAVADGALPYIHYFSVLTGLANQSLNDQSYARFLAHSWTGLAVLDAELNSRV